MLIERNNSDIVITIPSGILGNSELESLFDYLRYKEIAKKSKAKSKDLKSLVSLIKKNRKVKS